MKGGDPMPLIAAYFDDSGTHAQSDVAVAACFVSDVRRWVKFERKWKSILAEAGILGSGFHMADFVARTSPFDTWSEGERDDVIKRLIATIGSNVLDGMVTAVIKSDYDQLVTGKLREKLGHRHYTFAIQSCLAFIEQWRVINSQEPIEFIFDQMGKGKNEINDLFDDLIANKLAHHFGIEPRGWSFQNRRVIVQLQSADILAWESNRYMREHQFTCKIARKSFLSLINQVDIKTRFFDSSTLPEFVSDVTAKYERLDWNGPLGGFL
jgi:hypothetical protein